MNRFRIIFGIVTTWYGIAQAAEPLPVADLCSRTVPSTVTYSKAQWPFETDGAATKKP